MRTLLEELALGPITDPATPKVALVLPALDTELHRHVFTFVNVDQPDGAITPAAALDILDAADELDFAALLLDETALTRPTEDEAFYMMTAADIHSGQARLIRGLVADARIIPPN